MSAHAVLDDVDQPEVQLQLRPTDGDHLALAAAIDAWEASIVSEHTRRAYRRAMHRLITQYGEITPASLARLRDDMLRPPDGGRKARPSTVNQAMAAVLSAVRWMVTNGFVPPDILPPLEAVPRPPHRDDRPPTTPSPDQIAALRFVAPAIAYPGDLVRQANAAAVVAILATTGMRVEESVNARHENIRHARPRTRMLAATQGRPDSRAAAALQVLDGKGGVSRTVPFTTTPLEVLRTLAVVAGLTPRPSDPLLPALLGAPGRARIVDPVRPTSVRTVRRILAELGAALDYPPGVAAPHALRHAYALAQVDPSQRPDGKPVTLGVLQRRLGHSSPATTARYLRSGEDPDLPEG